MKLTILPLLIGLSKVIFCQSPQMDFNIECMTSFDLDKYQFNERIVDSVFKNNQLLISLETIDNCANRISKGSCKILNDTIFLYYEQIPTVRQEDSMEVIFVESCDCPFLVKYKIDNIEKGHYVVLLNNTQMDYSSQRFKTFPIEYVIVNQDTINLKDKYGLKQGHWIEKDSFDNITFEGNFIDNEWQNGFAKDFYENGKIKSEAIRKDFKLIKYRELDTFGNVTKELNK